MTFHDIIAHLGKRGFVTRRKWEGNSAVGVDNVLWMYSRPPKFRIDEIPLSYAFCCSRLTSHHRNPWTPCQEDILADDWLIVQVWWSTWSDNGKNLDDLWEAVNEAVDQRFTMYDNLDDMLWDISDTLSTEDGEEPFPILVKDNQQTDYIEFVHKTTNQRWGINRKVAQESRSPYKSLMQTPENRRKLAVGMAGIGFLKPEDMKKIDVRRSLDSGHWEFREDSGKHSF